MESVADERLHGLARFRWVPALVCAFAFVATARSEPPLAAASWSVVMFEESPSSRVLYLEESGGLVTPVAKLPPGSARQPLPPMPSREMKATASRPPIAREDPAASNTRLERRN